MYRYAINNDLHLPSNVDANILNLSNDEQFGLVKDIDFNGTTLASTLKVAASGAFQNFDSLSSYERLATAMGTPAVATYKNDLWNKDEEFGRQMLNGTNPILIKRCSSLPVNFPVTNDMVKGSLVRGLPLEDEMKVLLVLLILHCPVSYIVPSSLYAFRLVMSTSVT